MRNHRSHSVRLDLVILGIRPRPDRRPDIKAESTVSALAPASVARTPTTTAPVTVIALLAPEMSLDVMRRLMRHDKAKLVIIACPRDQRGGKDDLRPPCPVKTLIGIGRCIRARIDANVEIAIAPRRKPVPAIALCNRFDPSLHGQEPRLCPTHAIGRGRLGHSLRCRFHTADKDKSRTDGQGGLNDLTQWGTQCLVMIF